MKSKKKITMKGMFFALVLASLLGSGSIPVKAGNSTTTDKKSTTNIVWVTLGYTLTATPLNEENPKLPKTHSYDILYKDWAKDPDRDSKYQEASAMWRDKLAYYVQKSNVKVSGGMITTRHNITITINGKKQDLTNDDNVVKKINLNPGDDLYPYQKYVKGKLITKNGKCKFYMSPIIGIKEDGAFVKDSSGKVKEYRDWKSWKEARSWANSSTFKKHYNVPVVINKPAEEVTVNYYPMENGERIKKNTYSYYGYSDKKPTELAEHLKFTSKDDPTHIRNGVELNYKKLGLLNSEGENLNTIIYKGKTFVLSGIQVVTDGDKVGTTKYPNGSDDANNPSYGRITFNPGKDNVLSDLKDSKTGQLLNNTEVDLDKNMYEELNLPPRFNYNISTRASDNDIYQLLRNSTCTLGEETIINYLYTEVPPETPQVKEFKNYVYGGKDHVDWSAGQSRNLNKTDVKFGDTVTSKLAVKLKDTDHRVSGLARGSNPSNVIWEASEIKYYRNTKMPEKSTTHKKADGITNKTGAFPEITNSPSMLAKQRSFQFVYNKNYKNYYAIVDYKINVPQVSLYYYKDANGKYHLMKAIGTNAASSATAAVTSKKTEYGKAISASASNRLYEQVYRWDPDAEKKAIKNGEKTVTVNGKEVIKKTVYLSKSESKVVDLNNGGFKGYDGKANAWSNTKTLLTGKVVTDAKGKWSGSGDKLEFKTTATCYPTAFIFVYQDAPKVHVYTYTATAADGTKDTANRNWILTTAPKKANVPNPFEDGGTSMSPKSLATKNEHTAPFGKSGPVAAGVKGLIKLDGTLTEVGIGDTIPTDSTKVYEGYYYVKGKKPFENFNRIIDNDTMKSCYAKRRKSIKGTATLDDDVYIIKFIVPNPPVNKPTGCWTTAYVDTEKSTAIGKRFDRELMPRFVKSGDSISAETTLLSDDYGEVELSAVGIFTGVKPTNTTTTVYNGKSDAYVLTLDDYKNGFLPDKNGPGGNASYLTTSLLANDKFAKITTYNLMKDKYSPEGVTVTGVTWHEKTSAEDTSAEDWITKAISGIDKDNPGTWVVFIYKQKKAINKGALFLDDDGVYKPLVDGNMGCGSDFIKTPLTVMTKNVDVSYKPYVVQGGKIYKLVNIFSAANGVGGEGPKSLTVTGQSVDSLKRKVTITDGVKKVESDSTYNSRLGLTCMNLKIAQLAMKSVDNKGVDTANSPASGVYSKVAVSGDKIQVFAIYEKAEFDVPEPESESESDVVSFRDTTDMFKAISSSEALGDRQWVRGSASISNDLSKSSDKYDVLTGIPTTEYLKTEAIVPKYLVDIDFNKVTHKFTFSRNYVGLASGSYTETDTAGNTVEYFVTSLVKSTGSASKSCVNYSLKGATIWTPNDVTTSNYALPDSLGEKVTMFTKGLFTNGKGPKIHVEGEAQVEVPEWGFNDKQGAEFG